MSQPCRLLGIKTTPSRFYTAPLAGNSYMESPMHEFPPNRRDGEQRIPR